MTLSPLLDALHKAGALRTLDHALAQSLRRLDPATPDAVLAAAALASLAVAQGHAGLSLHAPQALVDAELRFDWPAADAWQAHLAASRWVSTPDDATAAADPHAPLVLEHGLLYLRRYREYERTLALGLQRIAAQCPAPGDLHALAPLFHRLFPRAPIPTRPGPAQHAGEGLEPRAEASRSPGTGADHDARKDLPLPPPAGEEPAPYLIRGRDGGAPHPEEKLEPGANLPLFPQAEAMPEARAQASRSPRTEAGRDARGDMPLPPPAGEEPAPYLIRGRDEGAPPPHDDPQARAAALALRHALLLVTGGPGTGKTTTTARLLALLAAQAKQAGAAPPRIALAAPTGRAAERMAESVRHAVQALAAQGVDADLLAALPTAGATLHRLLGTIPDSPRFRHDHDDPLPFDVVVVDEASMIDLPLMAKLVDAVADGTRLVLLGDPDQLPSVEAGDVLAAILGAAGDGDAVAGDDAEALRPLLGDLSDRRPRAGGDPATSRAAEAKARGPRLRGDDGVRGDDGMRKDDGVRADDATTFAGVRVHLHRGWRQSDALHLAPLAAAVRHGDADAALSLLRDGRLSNVHFHENQTDPLDAQRDRLLAHWRALGEAATPAEALALSTRLRVLTAVREGPQGARTLNARIERLLAENGGPARTVQAHFHGQPIIVTENSYRHRLFNGDIGICLRDDTGALVAWFPGDDPARPRAFHPAALPAHESAFAMTVHKAQGSEFDAVWLLLPARGNRVLSRELVYTGITRARRELHVAGSDAVIREALARHASRWSGLGWRLGAD